MKKNRVIDANIVLRFLTNDEPEMAQDCEMLLQRVEENKEQVYMPDIILADIVWTLEKFYKLSKPKICALLLPIIGLKGLRCNSKSSIRQAFDLYVENNIDWTDAFVAACMLSSGQNIIYSYDRDFDKVDGLIRSVPSTFE